VAPVNGRDRGQLMLIGALALAISLVVLALILNSGIYAHNLASRVDTDEEDAAGFETEMRAAVGGLVDHTVREDANDTGAQRNALDPGASNGPGVDGIERRLVPYRASESTVVEASFEGVTNGTVIRQDTDRNFTDRSGSLSDWTVVSDTEGVRAFELDVVRSRLNASTIGSLSGDAFEIELTNGSETWTVYVYRNGGSTAVVTKNASTATVYGPCTDDTGNRTAIDLTAGTVGGEYCRALRFFGPLPGSVDATEQLTVTYRNLGGSLSSSASINGTYRLVVEKSFADIADSRYADYGSGTDPYVAEGLYSAEVAIHYRGSELTYESTITVAPGEPS